MTHSNSFIDKQAYFLSYFVFFLNFYATICGELQVFECIQCALNRGAFCHVLRLTALSDAVTTPEMMPCAAARFSMPFAASFGSSAYTPPMQSEYLSYTWGEVTSQSLWSQCYRHFVGITPCYTHKMAIAL